MPCELIHFISLKTIQNLTSFKSQKNILQAFLRKFFKVNYGWSGDFPSWENAKKYAGSYEDVRILEKVKAATIKVKNKEALYERDSVLFDEIQYSWPLLAGIMWVAAKNMGKIHVADFGGSLGSSYFQNNQFIEKISIVNWSVIEQPNFVSCGIKHIQDERLRFYENFDSCISAHGLPDIVLLSCVLPYLEKPYEIIDQIIRLGIPHLLIDNTYFNYEKRDRISVQSVPPEIYKASYPCWLLNYDHVKAQISREFEIVSQHLNDSFIYVDGHKISYKGFLAIKKNENYR